MVKYWGDRNTKKFHATTVQRRNCNRIQRILEENGNWIEGQNDITKAVVNHFQEVFKSSPISGLDECLKYIPRLVTDDINKKNLNQFLMRKSRRLLTALENLRLQVRIYITDYFLRKNGTP